MKQEWKWLLVPGLLASWFSVTALAAEPWRPVWPASRLDALWNACPKGFKETHRVLDGLRRDFEPELEKWNREKLSAQLASEPRDARDAFLDLLTLVWPHSAPKGYLPAQVGIGSAGALASLMDALEEGRTKDARASYTAWEESLSVDYAGEPPETARRLLKCFRGFLPAGTVGRKK